MDNGTISDRVSYFNITTEQKIIEPENNSKAIYNYGDETVETSVSSIATREIQPSQNSTDYLLLETMIDDQFIVDAKPFIERPFYLNTVDWPSTVGRGYMLNNSNYSLMPGDVLRSNESLLSATKIASLYKCDLELCISVAGTITHSGCILAGIIPPLYGTIDYNASHISLINTILTGPHVRLFANEATSAMLKVPWYCNSEMATLDMELPNQNYKNTLDITPINGNYGTLVFVVMNQLQPSAGSSTSLKITVEAVFKSLDMRVPTPRYIKWTSQSSFFSSIGTGVINSLTSKAKTISADFIDKAREYIRFKTGLHNPNSSEIAQRVISTPRNFLNTIDTQTYYEKLDSKQKVDRIVDFPVFNTSTDEMTIQHIVSKKQWVGTFRVNVDDPTGTLLFSRPISPNMFNQDVSMNPHTYTNNIRLLHSLSRAWRGDLEITIESVMNNKQQVKLRLLQLYNPSNNILDGYPDYRSILNAPSHLMEFTAGGQTHSIVLPYMCRNELTPCAVEPNFEALFHGLFYIYVAQPMANSGDSPKDIYFNVYIQGKENLQFFGYSTECITTKIPVLLRSTFQSQSKVMEVMNEPQKQNDILSNEKEVLAVNRIQKIDSIRDYIRRVYNVCKFPLELRNGYNFFIIDIDPIWFEADNYFSNLYDSPLRAVSSMYYGKFPSTKFQVTINNFKNEEEKELPLITSIYYSPQSMFGYQPLSLAMGGLVVPTSASVCLNDQNIDFPIPYQNINTTYIESSKTHEFIIPNTSVYKFVGGPKKMSYDAYPNPPYKTSTQDCGTIILKIFNPGSESRVVEIFLNAGAADEARLGFHCIAPEVSIPRFVDPNAITLGTGAFNSLSNFPPVSPQPYINYTRV